MRRREITMQNKHRSRQAGVGLIELMVSVLVLSIGLVALARLQIELVRGAADSRARSAAVALAEEKLEDLRSYAVVDGGGTWNPTNAVDPTFEMAWSYIDEDEGGRILPESRELEGVNYTLSWAVSNITYTTSLGPEPGIPTDYKDVTVTVAWEDADADTDPQQVQVQLTGSIMGIPPGNVAAASQSLSARPNGPEVLYTPGEAPEIISVPIDVGDGKKRETTKPLPDVQAQGDYSHEVRFDVVNYQNVGGENLVTRREEFVTVNCRCTLEASGNGRTPARVAFVGGVLRDQPGAVRFDKPFTGTVRTSGSNAKSSQPVLCSICCRDHHDGPSVTVGSDTDNNRYDPTDTSDHRHYLIDGGTYDLASVGDPYDEACRLKRVNGVFQVYEDWRLETLTVVPPGYLEDLTTTQQDYVTYVQEFVEESVRPSGAVPDKTSLTNRDFSVGEGANEQTFSRAIYLDNIPDELRAVIDGRLAQSPPLPVLELVPFFEVNLTKLADWDLAMPDDGSPQVPANDGLDCPLADMSGTVACVTNEEIIDEGIGPPTYSRGVVVGGGTAGTRRDVATAKVANTGLVGVPAISADDEPAISDYVLAEVTGTPGIGGTFLFCAGVTTGNKKKLVRQASISVSPGGTTTCTTDDTSFTWRCEPVEVPVTVSITDGDTTRAPTVYPSPSSQPVTPSDDDVVFTLCDSP